MNFDPSYEYAPTSTEPLHETVFVRGLRLVRDHKAVIVAALVVAVVAAVALSLAQSKRYSATATILISDPTANVINPQSANTGVDPQRAVATNQQLLSLNVVEQGTSQALHGTVSPSRVSSEVSVGSVGQTDLLRVTATTPSAAGAALLANTYAKTYLAIEANGARQQIDQAIAGVRSQLDTVTTNSERQQLLSRLNDLVVARSVTGSGARLAQPAVVPGSPVSNHLVRNVLLSLLIGLLVGLLLAVLLDRLSGRLKDVDETERLFGVPLLATVPRTRWLVGKQVGPGMLTGPDAEPFRGLRASLRYAGMPDDRQTIMVVSPSAGDGKSTIARQLAAVMAATGDSVVLVEADLNERPGPRIFGRHNGNGGGSEPGLTQLLSSHEPITDQALRRDLTFVRLTANGNGRANGNERWLTVLPSGPPVNNPSELLESDQMREVLERLQQHFTTVIVDTPALGVVSDAMSLLPVSDGIIVVAALGQTTHKQADELIRRLNLVDARVIGVVTNFVPPESVHYAYGRRPAGLLTRITG